MKISLSILFIAILVQFSYSQNHIYVGANVSPSITIPILKTKDPSINESFNYSAGLNGLYFFSNQIFMKTGINYSQKSLMFEDVPDTRNAWVDLNGNGIMETNELSDEIITFDAWEIYQSINLPVTINYRLSEVHKASILFSGGFELGYLFNLKYIWDYESRGEEIWNKKLNHLFVSINLGVGLYQPIANKFLLLVIPKYSYDFYPARGRDNSSFNFHTIYIDTEFYFKLN